MKPIVLLLLILIYPLQEVSAKSNCIFISVGTFHTFWDSVIRGTIDAAKRHNYEVIERSVYTDETKSKLEDQIRLLKWNSATHQCQGIVLAPMDFGVSDTVEQLKQNNIYTIYVDRDDGTEATIGSITTNNFKAGELAAEKMAEKIGANQEIGIFRLAPDVATTQARVDGFIKRAEEVGLKIAVIDFLGGTYGEARASSTQLLKRYPNLAGIFTPNEITLMGTAASLEIIDNKKVILIGFDINSRISAQISREYIYGTVLQNPYRMGYKAVEYLKKAMEGETVRVQYETNIYFLTKQNKKQNKAIEMLKGYGIEE